MLRVRYSMRLCVFIFTRLRGYAPVKVRTRKRLISSYCRKLKVKGKTGGKGTKCSLPTRIFPRDVSSIGLHVGG